MHISLRFRLVWVLAVLPGCGGGGGGVPDTLPGDPGPRDAMNDLSGVPCHRDLDCAGIQTPPCRKASCDHGTGTCVILPDPDLEGALCVPSENLCAVGDGRCKEGACVPASVKNCDDHDPCTGDSCNPATGACDHLPLDRTPCDDGDACTDDDRCREGTCTPGTRICQCTRDDDCPTPENPCLGRYFCNTDQKVCEVVPGTAVTCEVPGNPCQEAFCDPADGQCRTRNREDTTPCDDGNPCTLDDACLQGACVGRDRDCNDGNACTEDLCDPETGECSRVDLSDVPCDDGDLCTTGETCREGHCGGGARVFDCCHEDADCDDGFGCSLETCTDHRCIFQALECPSEEDACRPNLCRTDRCEEVPLFRRQRVLDLPFAGSLPPGARLDPPDGWDLNENGLSRPAGTSAGRVHLPPFRTGTGLNYLAAYQQPGPGRVRALVQKTLVPWDYQDASLAMAPLETGIQDVALEVPPETRLSRVQVLHFPGESCGATAPAVTDTAVVDFALADNGRGELVAGYLFRSGSRYRFALQSFDEEGRPLGTFTQVPEEYPVAHPRFRVQGYWAGDRFVLVYGAVEVGGASRIRRVEFRDGQVLALGFLSDRPDNQFEPALARAPGRLAACYTSHDIDASGLGIACRQGTGPWAAINQRTFGDQSQPDVALFPDGRTLVVWSDDEGAIRGRIPEDGERGEFPIQPTVLGATFSRPRVAISGTTAMVVFEGTGVAGDDGTGVFGRVVREGLVDPSLIDFQDNLPGDQRLPEVAPTGDGFLVSLANDATSDVWVVGVNDRGSVDGRQFLQSPDWAYGPCHLIREDPFLLRVGFLDLSGKVRMNLVSSACKEGWHAAGKTCIGPGYR